MEILVNVYNNLLYISVECKETSTEARVYKQSPKDTIAEEMGSDLRAKVWWNYLLDITSNDMTERIIMRRINPYS